METKQQLRAQIQDKDFPMKNGDYSYLTNMATLSMTDEAYDELEAESAKLQRAMEKLQETHPTDLWRSELDELEVALREYDARAQQNRPDVAAFTKL